MRRYYRYYTPTNADRFILDSPSDSPPLEHPEFIQGSSSDNAHASQLDLDTLKLAKRLQASASFNDDDEDNIWNQSCSDQWAF